MGSYPQRRPIRLTSFDYASNGAYFVTLCIEGRLPLLGRITDGTIHRTSAGDMIHTVWSGLGRYYPGVVIDAFVIMPNHLHGILILTEDAAEASRDRAGEPGSSCHVTYGEAGRTNKRAMLRTGRGHAEDNMASRDLAGAPSHPRISLQSVVERFKSFTTHEYGKGVAREGWPRYPGRLWQYRYHDRVIRNDRELNAVRDYIANNPLQWHLDHENPERTVSQPPR